MMFTQAALAGWVEKWSFVIFWADMPQTQICRQISWPDPHPPRYASLATVRNSCHPEIYLENDEWHGIIVFERSKLRQLTVFAKQRHQTFRENMGN